MLGDTQVIAIVMNVIFFFIVLIITLLTHLWFTGALVHDINYKKGFETGLKYSRGIFWQLLFLSVVLALLLGISSMFRWFGFLLQIIISIIFIFSVPFLVIKKEKFETALAGSYNIVKRNALQTIVFWILLQLIMFAILFIAIVFVSLISSPIVVNMMPYIRTVDFADAYSAGLFNNLLINSIVSNYALFILSLAVASFFLSFCVAFGLTSKTYYFLELAKRKQ
jgi:hypothetical protein